MKELSPAPKPQRIKSKALTESAKGRACTLRIDGPNNCSSPETVVFCHVRVNSGIATKSPDFFGFFGCRHCHSEQERGNACDRQTMRAILETQTIMASEGLLTVKGWSPR
jgi:hypothetical protein